MFFIWHLWYNAHRHYTSADLPSDEGGQFPRQIMCIPRSEHVRRTNTDTENSGRNEGKIKCLLKR